MQIFRTLAGYSLGRADIVRRAMAKKKHDVMERERKSFIYGEKDAEGNVLCTGALAAGVSEEAAEKIFNDMSGFSSYAFNKAHAAAYSFVAYRTAYLKCHYTAEYFASLMTGMIDSVSKISLYTSECKKNGIKILPPSVNRSEAGFIPENGNIRFGLMAVKNLGVGIIEKLVNERKQNGEYTSMYDFCYRNYSREFNRKALEGLIKSGAMDGLEANRRQMLYNTDGVIEAVENERRFSAEGQMNLFDEMGEKPEYRQQPVPEMPEEMLLSLEKEATGLYLSGHPMERFAGFAASGVDSTADIISGKYKDGRRVTLAGIVSGLKIRQLKNNNLLGTGMIEDMDGAVPVTVFAAALEQFKQLLVSGEPLIVNGRISEREDRDTEVIIEKAEKIPENAQNTAAPKYRKGLYLKVPDTNGELFNKVRQILSENGGDYTVIIYCTSTGKKLKAPDTLKIAPSSGLFNKLKALLGEANVKFIK